MRIGLFLNNLDEEYQLSVFKGIKSEASALGLELICIQGESLSSKIRISSKEDALPELFPSRYLIGADGILFLSSVLFERNNPEFQEQLKRMFTDFPFVSLGDRLYDYHSILVTSEKPMWNLMEHLLTMHKYKKFLFIGGPAEHPDNIVRENIFKEAIQKYRQNDPLVEGSVINGNFVEISGMNITRNYMNQHPDDPPDVIVAANDTMAIGARNIILAHEDPRWNKCPVTGFDDISQSGLEIPVLTTIRQPLAELGKLGVRTLYDLIQGKEVPTTFFVSAELIIRSSCGCPLKSDHKSTNLAQYRTIYDLRHISALGKSLTAINTYEEMLDPLNSFLSNLNVPHFFLIIYDQPRFDIGQEGKMIYERTPEKDHFSLDNAREIKISDFFNDLGSYTKSSQIWCMKHLCSGNEYLGLVIYEAQDILQPQLCNGFILLANTVKRLFLNREKMDRAIQLERDVSFRTRDLLETNKKLREEVDKRVKVEAEVFRINEMERRRFSMDLYDEICGRLTDISLAGMNLAADRKSHRQTAALKKISSDIDEMLLKTRRYANASFPVELVTGGLNDSLKTLCSETNKNIRMKCVYFWNAGEASPLTQSQDINVYWIIQEAVQNSVSYSRASRISITISFESSLFTAQVQDNGTGNSLLNSGNSLPNDKGREGLGLRSMRHWARQAGADYYFHSTEAGGTTVKLLIPVNKKI